ncbi:hypothetical protein Tco_0465591 [Tanacetum coccineum]
MSCPGQIRIARRRRIPGGATTSARGNSDDGAITADGAGRMGAVGISRVEVVGDTCLSSISVSDPESSEHRKGETIGDYDLWSMRMKQYLTQTDYALWEVIVNGDAPTMASASAGTEGYIPPKTAKQKLARKNELKAKSTLLLAIPDEHLLKFHGIKDAKTYGKQSRPGFEATKNQRKCRKPY